MVRTGFAWYESCHNGAYGGRELASIRVMSLSARQDVRCCSSLGHEFSDPDNFIGTLVHEVIHHIQTLVRRTRGPRALQTWDFPRWFMEGMAEWEGRTRTTPFWEREGAGLYLNHVDEKGRGTVSCCYSLGSNTSIAFSNLYQTPTVFMIYLEDTFGEAIVADLLRTRAETFYEALNHELETRGSSLPEVFRDFQGWFWPQSPSQAPVLNLPLTPECNFQRPVPITPRPRHPPSRSRRRPR